MDQDAPHAVLFDEGELDDVREVLRELGVPHSDVDRADPECRVPLLLSSVPRAQAIASGLVAAPPHQLHVAVASDGDPGGVVCDFLLTRPIEPAVLRLVTRRAEYEGSERRRVTRVAVGSPVKIRSGGDEREVILAQISIGGCGLISALPLQPDTAIEVSVPPELTSPRDLTLVGRVLSSREVPTADGATFDISVAFDDLDLVDRVTLRALMGAQTVDFRPHTKPAASRSSIGSHRRALPSEGERRQGSRRRFRRHVMAAHGSAAYVLMGRDLSADGMRVEPHDALCEGQRLKLAIYGRDDAAPVLIEATVDRDDGGEGHFLGFRDLAPHVRGEFDALLETLAPVELHDRVGRREPGAPGSS